MSLDKAIAKGEEYRKPFRKAKAVDRTCRNNGTCKTCWGNRTFANRRAEKLVDEDYEAWKRGELVDEQN